MRKIVAVLWVSLDGVVESPEQWISPYFDEEYGQVLQSWRDASDTMVLGRRTYEVFAAYWPDKTAEDEPVADYINNTPKLVVSTTLKSVEWRNSTLIKGDVAKALTKVKQQPGTNISIIGSATLVRSLLRDGLLDELRLMLFPIVVGTGKRLFDEWTDQVPLELVESRAFKTGVLSLIYQPAGT